MLHVVGRSWYATFLVAWLGASRGACSCQADDAPKSEPRSSTQPSGPARDDASVPSPRTSGPEPASTRNRDDADPEEIGRLLLTLRDFRERAAAARAGYELRVDCPDRSLLYLGFRHSTDPADPTFASLEQRWQSYERESAGRHRVVLVEGRVRKVTPTRDAAIREGGGEGGLVSFLARAAGATALESPEPDSDETARQLGSRFSSDEICLAYFARSVALWHAQGARSALEPFIAGLPLPRAAGCDFTVAAMRPISQRLLGQPLDIADAAALRRLVDPARDDTVVGRLLAEETRRRDVHIVRQIERRFSAGTSLFAVYGTAHVVMQEPALRALLCRRCEPDRCRIAASTVQGESVPSSSAASTP